METIHADDSPLGAFLEGEGTFEPELGDDNDKRPLDQSDPDSSHDEAHSRQLFAPPSQLALYPRVKIPHPHPIAAVSPPASALTRIHHAWSSAVNSRLGAADNARFLEQFRYIIVASQMLNEYLDHGSLNPESTPTVPGIGLDGASDGPSRPKDTANVLGAVSAAAVALAVVFLIDWLRSRRLNKSKVTLVLTTLAITAFVGYGCLRRQWLHHLRRQAVDAATGLTTNWQAFEVSSSSALTFIQEVELVSKGYRLSTPLPPASRLEANVTSRRCAKLRVALYNAYASIIPACIEAGDSLRVLVDNNDLEKYFEIYDLSLQDAREVAGSDVLQPVDNDPESLNSLRLFSYRSGILRRVMLCSLMALEADGGKADFHRWRIAAQVIDKLSRIIASSAERVRHLLTELESFSLPSPGKLVAETPVREKMRGQVRKISALNTGIRGLQAKMQILREETNRSLEQSEDLSDLGPSLMAQYDNIGADIRDLLSSWEAGKQALQSNITRHERRISMASSGSGLRSPVSSIGGLTAVEEVEGGSPAHALRVLNGDLNELKSNRSSMNTSQSEEEMVFEAVAMPRQRASTLTREERIVKMHEERARQADLRAKRDANTSMLRELESVINLRPKKANANGTPTTRVTSI